MGNTGIFNIEDTGISNIENIRIQYWEYRVSKTETEGYPMFCPLAFLALPLVSSLDWEPQYELSVSHTTYLLET